MTNSTATTAGSDAAAARTPDLKAITHVVLRVGAGLLFFMHGTPKLFGWFGGMGEPGTAASLFSLMGLAGVLEVFGGLLLVIGLFTPVVAAILGLEMLVAFGRAHAPRGLVPYENGGELALLYLCVFILLVGWGAGPLSVDSWRRQRRNE